jgi:hypothetical protein
MPREKSVPVWCKPKTFIPKHLQHQVMFVESGHENLSDFEGQQLSHKLCQKNACTGQRFPFVLFIRRMQGASCISKTQHDPLLSSGKVTSWR